MNTDRLTPFLWDAPLKPYHLKPINADYVVGGKMRKSNIYVCHDCGELVAYARRNDEQYLCEVVTWYRGRNRSFKLMHTARHSRFCKPIAAGTIHPKALDYIHQQERLWQRVGSTPIVGIQLLMDWEMDLAMGRAMDDVRGI